MTHASRKECAATGGSSLGTDRITAERTSQTMRTARSRGFSREVTSKAFSLLWLVLVSVSLSTGQDPATMPQTQQSTGLRSAKMVCGPADRDRLLYKEAATYTVIAHLSCDEEVTVLAKFDTANVYQIHRNSGEIGFVFASAIDKPSAEQANAKGAKPSRTEKRANKICEKNPSWQYSDCINVTEGHVLVGMTYAMVVAAWGTPMGSETTQLPGGHYSLQLVYNNPNGGFGGLLNNLSCNMPNSDPTTCTTFKNTYVNIWDGVVTTIQN
jgi:hypothetical protein